MAQLLSTHFLPELTTPEQLAGGVVVVIDVLRASTTITAALAAGALEVIPCLEVDEALERAAKLPAGEAVLGGEREGLPIDGFHLGNSPSEYTAASVGGKHLVFTTTNGTKAMIRCRQAERVLIGAFVNHTALCRMLTEQASPIHLLCAGTRGEITREDVLLAGAVADRLTSPRRDNFQLNDQARIARESWQAALLGTAARPSRDERRRHLTATLAETQGGRNLIAVGLEPDLTDAGCLDHCLLVPELDLAAWSIVGQSVPD